MARTRSPARTGAALAWAFIFAVTGVSPISASAAEGDQERIDPRVDPRNFEGTWVDLPTNSPFLLGIDLPYRPAAQNIAADRLELFKNGNAAASAHLTCRPTGVQGVTSPKGPVLVLQTPEQMIFMSEEDREVRRVYLNGEHPSDLRPSYSGDSVARWEGDTLVIDTVGYNGRGQLDEVGNPHGSQLHMVQRLTKSEDGNFLTSEVTFTDPEYYEEPFTKVRRWQRISGTKLVDYDCAENPRSDLFEHLTWQHDWFRPTCVLPIVNGAAGDRVVCTPADVNAARQPE